MSKGLHTQNRRENLLKDVRFVYISSCIIIVDVVVVIVVFVVVVGIVDIITKRVDLLRTLNRNTSENLNEKI